ncbi:MAG: helix-hairpin-helix domain-containing protein [Lachnospiraceae bacterium]|nr:helix-hairpin-helix domain-containing protein [Lachnospiraceae bacterium]
MKITKMQNFIYSGWVYLVVLWNGLLILGMNVTTFLYGDMIVDVLFAMMLSVPWLIAAITSRDRKAWIRFLAILSADIAINALMHFFAVGMLDNEFLNSPLVSIVSGIQKLFYIGLIVCAIRLREEIVEKCVLARLGQKADTTVDAAQRKQQSQWVKKQKEKQANKPKLDFDEVMPTEEAVKTEEPVKQEPMKQEKAERLDINVCGEEDFLTLPGMSLSSAKRAVELRDTQGDYRSVDDFVARNGIKPHFMVQMESRIYVKEKVEKMSPETPRRGRMLDL